MQLTHGVLEDEFVARQVWNWTKVVSQAREEWLIIRIERSGEQKYTLSKAPLNTPLVQVAEGFCSHYFAEQMS